MAERTGPSVVDFMRVGIMFTRRTHPVRISKQWTTRRNACWELGVTSWTRGTPTQTVDCCTGNDEEHISINL